MKISTNRKKGKTILRLASIIFAFVLSLSLAYGKTSTYVYAQSEAEALGKNYPSAVLDTSKIKDINYLKETFYYINPKTDISLSDIDIEKFLKYDLSIALDGDKPKVLIFHAHSSEMYSDSKNKNDGVIAVGEKLKEVLEQQYNIPTIHCTTAFDMLNGEKQRVSAYDRAEEDIARILKDNPSIEIIIDLHRDAVAMEDKLVTIINSNPTAQIRFVNGLSKIYNSGILEPIEDLPNPYVFDNLAFSFNLQLTANSLYPDFAKKIYVAPYRYSLHMLPKSLIIYVGAQTNTQREAENAAPIIAEILAGNI